MRTGSCQIIGFQPTDGPSRFAKISGGISLKKNFHISLLPNLAKYSCGSFATLAVTQNCQWKTVLGFIGSKLGFQF
jgi:hypothetical protein